MLTTNYLRPGASTSCSAIALHLYFFSYTPFICDHCRASQSEVPVCVKVKVGVESQEPNNRVKSGTIRSLKQLIRKVKLSSHIIYY
jgi:hypothetical protein